MKSISHPMDHIFSKNLRNKYGPHHARKNFGNGLSLEIKRFVSSIGPIGESVSTYDIVFWDKKIVYEGFAEPRYCIALFITRGAMNFYKKGCYISREVAMDEFLKYPKFFEWLLFSGILSGGLECD